MRLAEISKIRTGQTFKSSIELKEGGDLSVIQPKNILDGKFISDPVKVFSSDVSPLHKHLLRKGDILVVNKGLKFGTFLYDNEPTYAVATSSFFVITPSENRLLSKFLIWYLEQSPAKSHFAKNISGSTIPSITIGVLSNLEIPVLSLEKQQYISELLVDSEKEIELLKNLTLNRQQYLDCHIWELISKDIL